jgi:hypothetical protein
MRNVGINLTYIPETVVRDIAKAKVLDPNVGGVFFLQFKFRIPSQSH